MDNESNDNLIKDESIEEKNNIEKLEPIDSSNDSNIIVENSNTDSNDDNNYKFKKSRKKKFFIIISVILLIELILILIMNCMEQYNAKKIKKYLENDAIIQAYGDKVTIKVNEYMISNDGKIPKFEDIKDTIDFTDHKVECKISIINDDGSVYLTECYIDNNKVSKNLSYGNLQKEPQKTGNKIYIYKRSYSDVDIITGDVTIRNYYDFFSKPSSQEDLEYIGEYECYSIFCKGYDYSEYLNKALIKDIGYKLYDISTKKSQNLSLNNVEYKSISFVEDSNKVYGLMIAKKEYSAFFNLDSSKFITDFNYTRAYTLNSLVNKGYILLEYGDNTYLLNYQTGEIEKTIEQCANFQEIVINNTVLYKAYYGYYTYLLDSNFNPLIKSDNDYSFAVNSDNTITINLYDDNKFSLYNLSGEVIKTSKEYKQIISVLKDYVIVIDKNDDLKILDLSENEIKTFLHVTDRYTVQSIASGWYNENGKNGIYIVVEDKEIPNGTMGCQLEYYYIPSTKETGVIKKDNVGEYAKPVLYLYPTKKTNVTVSFEKPYLLTTTYPKYKNSWNVIANTNGDLYDSKGNYYYGLYWEEKGTTNVDFDTGFYVTKENAIEFLEEKLNIIGLNARERNEFIMYWLPILEKNEQSLVYFELTEQRNKYNKLIIKPTPDSMLRLAIHVKKVDHPIKIKEEKLSTFKRKGFTVVEWGGVVH